MHCKSHFFLLKLVFLPPRSLHNTTLPHLQNSKTLSWQHIAPYSEAWCLCLASVQENKFSQRKPVFPQNSKQWQGLRLCRHRNRNRKAPGSLLWQHQTCCNIELNVAIRTVENLYSTNSAVSETKLLGRTMLRTISVQQSKYEKRRSCRSSSHAGNYGRQSQIPRYETDVSGLNFLRQRFIQKSSGMHLRTSLSFFSKREAKHFTVVSTTWRYENSVPLANQKRKESSDTYRMQDETENRTAFPFLPRNTHQNHNFPKKKDWWKQNYVHGNTDSLSLRQNKAET